MSDNIEQFINNLQKDSNGHVVLNMLDYSILHDSFLESALRCSAPEHEHKPEIVRYVKGKDPWGGITIFTRWRG